MPSLFETNITEIKGIGEKKAKLFNKLGLYSVGDLIKFYPRNYLDWNKFTNVEDAENGEVAIIKATIDTKFVTTRVKGGKLLIKGTASDDTGTIRLTFFNNKFIPNLLKYGETYVFRGRIQGGYGLPEMTSPEFISEEKKLSPFSKLLFVKCCLNTERVTTARILSRVCSFPAYLRNFISISEFISLLPAGNEYLMASTLNSQFSSTLTLTEPSLLRSIL